MRGLHPETARCLRSRTVLLVSAAGSVANALERLCDGDLGEVDRQNATAALRSHLADVQVVVAVVDEALSGARGSGADAGSDVAAEGHVLTVSSWRWRRRTSGRGSQMAESEGGGGRRYRVEPWSTGLALVSPRGTIVTVYPASERARAEEDARRLSGVELEIPSAVLDARRRASVRRR